MTDPQRKLLTSIVYFFGQVLGPDYEILLQDLTDKNHSVVAIANGEISGRTVGSPITDAALDLLTNKKYEGTDYLVNYQGTTTQDTMLRSSTLFIKDADGVPYALLCVNFDDRRYIELHDKILALAHPLSFLKQYSTHTVQPANIPEYFELQNTADTMNENFPPDIDTLMNTIYQTVITNSPFPDGRLNQEERIQVIKLLHQQGLFKLKGAVSFVAKKLACSTASIYRYLNGIR